MSATLLTPAIEGFSLAAGLIIAIGAQNALVLRLGLARHHVGPAVLFCALSDAVLIAAGCAGLGTLVAAHPAALRLIALIGAAVLVLYGLRAAWRAVTPGRLEAAGAAAGALGPTLGALALVTWLNPHVYLDTVILLGSLAGRYPVGARLAFGCGAVLASTLWFAGLGFGARLLAPLFARPATWRLLDGLIALTMFALAGRLLVDAV